MRGLDGGLALLECSVVCDRAHTDGRRRLCGPVTPPVSIVLTVINIHQPASLDLTTKAEDHTQPGQFAPHPRCTPVGADLCGAARRPLDRSGVDHRHLPETVVASPSRHHETDHHAVGRGMPGAHPGAGTGPGRVHAVTPGLIDTRLLHATDGAERDTIVNNWATILPGRRVGAADEVAEAILMLMTNDYMTGKVVHVNGGGRFV
jgi:hypothetical protein